MDGRTDGQAFLRCSAWIGGREQREGGRVCHCGHPPFPSLGGDPCLPGQSPPPPALLALPIASSLILLPWSGVALIDRRRRQRRKPLRKRAGKSVVVTAEGPSKVGLTAAAALSYIFGHAGRKEGRKEGSKAGWPDGRHSRQAGCKTMKMEATVRPRFGSLRE